MKPGLVKAARLVVRDPAGAVLLFRYDTDRGPCWATPGGRVEAGESFAAAASREAWEELGLRASPTEILWEETVEFVGRGAPVVRHQQFFGISVSRARVRDDPDVTERQTAEGVIAHRWWTLDALDSTTERIVPPDLRARLAETKGSFFQML